MNFSLTLLTDEQFFFLYLLFTYYYCTLNIFVIIEMKSISNFVNRALDIFCCCCYWIFFSFSVRFVDFTVLHHFKFVFPPVMIHESENLVCISILDEIGCVVNEETKQNSKKKNKMKNKREFCHAFVTSLCNQFVVEVKLNNTNN